MKLIVKNKKAYFDYHIEEKFICGMVLVGTEVKSIRSNHCSIKEAYCYINEGEVWIKGMFIKEFQQGTYNNHEEVHDRKLLLQRREINKLIKLISRKGYTLVPLAVLISNKRIKLEIGVGQGKKLYDKRQSIKEKDIKRDLER